MDLKSGYPFWLAKNGVIRTYDPLESSLTTDVLVIGGGITGAMLARSLTDAGVECVVLDRRNIGWGSTSASTSLLQYELDTHLTELAGMMGEADAVLAYRNCRDAVGSAESLCRALGAGDFVPKESFYFASRTRDVETLREEFEFRRKHGFDVQWLDRDDIAGKFDLQSGGGILSHAAEVDAFQLTHALLHDASRRGVRVYARTDVSEIDSSDDGVTVRTTRGPTIRCRQVAVACGYESGAHLRKPPEVKFCSSYAIVSEPLTSFERWHNRCLLWESARPYSYVRATTDGRGILGGEDIPFHNEIARDTLLPYKVAKLERRWGELFPRIPLEVAFHWTGTFAETADGLPFIGFPTGHPRTFFAMCYGGNGVIFSVLAAEMLVAALQGRRHPCESLFRFDRPSAAG